MSRLSLYLLGPPRIDRDGDPIQVDTRKAIALLAYIAIAGESQRRDALVNLLWPEYDQSRGRTVLRRTLYALRKALAGDWLRVDRENVGLNPIPDLWLDVDQFHVHLAECLSHGHPASEACPACLAPLSDAVELYRGDFLSGFSLKDSFNFDDWQFFQTESLRRELSDALERLVRGYGARGEFASATKCARRWLALDRLNESAHYQLMLLYAWSGQRSAALRQYRECVRILESQLSASPQESTVALYQAIAEGRAPEPPIVRSVQRLVKSAIAPKPEPLLLEEERRPVPKPTPVLADEAKRLVTVLLADASGSFTAMDEASPEDEASLMARFIKVMSDVVTEHCGQVDRTLGGSVLALFGVAGTHESDPELAIRAALAAQEEVGTLGLCLRAGIDTGEVLFQKTDAGQERPDILVGRAIDLAVRLARRAQVGQILVGEPTYRLTRRAFEFTPLSLDVKARDGSVHAYRVERLLPQPKKARGIEGLRAELIGRDEELAKLKAALAQVLRGRGRMVSLIGDAGVGKSRLVTELREVALTDDDQSIPLWLEGRCLEMGTAASYAPFIDILHQYFAWGAREADRRRWERMVASLQGMAEQGHLANERAEEMAALLGHLLSLPIGDEWGKRLEGDDPEQIRWRTFAAVHDLFFALARQQPLVLVFEDLHWADSLSLDLISMLMESLPLGHLLLLCVYRPEREHRCWHLGTIAAQKCRGRYVELRLRELSHQQSRRLVASLLSTDDLPSSIGELILARSQGNPFYIEEVVRSLIDAGIVSREGDAWRVREEVGTVAIPESVQSVILDRIDHLEESWKRVLRVASVIGRAFCRRVLDRAMGQETELERALWELEDRALIYQERTVPEVEYSFKHVLTRETVYRNMVRHRRQEFHQRVAGAIEVLYRDNLEGHYEQLAHHYEESGDVQKAIAYLLKAGEKAKRGYANEEAIAHLARGLRLLKATPETSERSRQELALQIALGVPLIHTKGHAAPEVEATYGRARELCEQVGDIPQLFQVLFGLRRCYSMRGELRRAYELGERMLALASSMQDPTPLSLAHLVQAETLYWLGEFAQVREHCERGFALHDPLQRRSQALLYGNDAGVACRILKAWALWHLGYPDQALRASHEGLARAQELSYPFTLAFALGFTASLHQFRREPQAVQERAEATIALSTERGFAMYSAWGTILHGWALAEQGQVDEGIDEMRRGIAAWRVIGAAMMLSNWLASLAEAYAKVGRREGALRLLDEALSLVGRNEERCWEAELHRLKGKLFLKEGREAQAEACFQHALDVARRQSAKSWQLRAATSLSRLWHRQDKRKEARELLQGVYDWFSEGFDTADLVEAKALLDELS